IQELMDTLEPLGITSNSSPELAVSAAEFLLEGMTAHRRITRSEERSFSAGDKARRNEQAANFHETVREREKERAEWEAKNRTRRGFN
ncbi:MAG: magnesium chelatase, partial [Acidobacteriaceae bacterium]|nr:magnesium chelatase [Acidobacteriaceae bacterium]